MSDTLSEEDRVWKEIPDHDSNLWNQIPARFHGGLRRYFLDHILPGSFLTAVLQNDLSKAWTAADHASWGSVGAIVEYLYQCAPGKSWGSVERVEEWASDTFLTKKN